MGLFTKAKLKSINQNLLPKHWLNHTHDDFTIVGGKLVLKPLTPKRLVEPLIFIEYDGTQNN